MKLRQHLFTLSLLIAFFPNQKSYSQEFPSTNWGDSLSKYLKTPPNISIPAIQHILSLTELEDSSRVQIDFMVAIVNDYAQMRNIDSALSFALRSNKMAIEIKDSMRISRTFLSIAWVRRDKGDIPAVLKNTLKSQSIAEKIGSKKLEAYAANTLASVYYDMKNDSLQKFYLEKSYRLEKELGISPISSLTNLGYLYFKEGELDTAKSMWFEALGLSNKDRQSYQSKLLLFAHLIDLYEIEKNYLKSIDMIDSVLIEITQLKWDDGIVHNTMKRKFFQSKLGLKVNYKGALERFNAIDISPYDIDAKKIYLYDKYRFNAQFKNYEQAIKYIEKHRVLNDSLANIELQTQIAYYKEQFEADQREKEILQLQAEQEIISIESSKQKSQIIYLAIIMAFAFCFVIFLVFLYRNLKKTKNKLEEANRTKDKFFSIIGHDLRSPMIGLEGVGQKLDYYIKNGKQEKLQILGSQIDKSIHQLNFLLNNLLSWAMSQLGSLPFHPQKIEIKNLVLENVELLGNYADSKGIILSSAIKDNSVFGDSNTISTFLRNIISNAIKYSSEGGEVKILGKESKGCFEIQIMDQGSGISPEKLKAILDFKNFSSEGSKGEKGFGLGLKISQEFIQKNKGSLKIQSEVGKGSQFIINLPSNH